MANYLSNQFIYPSIFFMFFFVCCAYVHINQNEFCPLVNYYYLVVIIPFNSSISIDDWINHRKINKKYIHIEIEIEIFLDRNNYLSKKNMDFSFHKFLIEWYFVFSYGNLMIEKNEKFLQSFLVFLRLNKCGDDCK